MTLNKLFVAGFMTLIMAFSAITAEAQNASGNRYNVQKTQKSNSGWRTDPAVRENTEVKGWGVKEENRGKHSSKGWNVRQNVRTGVPGSQ